MKVFFTADCHFSHDKIRLYTNRPFKTVERMNDTIVKRWNEKVGINDLVYHVGDFAFKGQLNADKYERILNGRIVHIRGNHDKNNGVKTYVDKCMMFFGGKDVFVSHNPPEIIPTCDFAICGHVLNNWKYRWLDKRTPVINVPLVLQLHF